MMTSHQLKARLFRLTKDILDGEAGGRTEFTFRVLKTELLLVRIHPKKTLVDGKTAQRFVSARRVLRHNPEEHFTLAGGYAHYLPAAIRQALTGVYDLDTVKPV